MARPNEPPRFDEIDLLEPSFRERIKELLKLLNTYYEKGLIPFLFKVFETYRTPARQKWLKDGKPPRTRAAPWKSPHNYGLAVDLVPFVNGQFDWDVSIEHWDALREAAESLGLSNGLSWDRAHVELADWQGAAKKTPHFLG